MIRYDTLDILGIWCCLSLLAALGLWRLGLFLSGRLRPRWPREQHPSYFSEAARRVPEDCE